ncbi:hypothetical protein C8F04DRAFT_1394743 [Mycena alexandri]|uniref:F-box domain-containing protein n=1 Tax=Mycena alexandri TaxID=1745969 RepID=A0AAD6SX41_9AGAR|nr:hypothetical protein C8F04DRAFT_1394743 [Mycena alexandri]
MTTPRSVRLSDRPTEYQNQSTLVRGADGAVSFTPINRFALTLPPELTSEIFLHCLPDTEFIRPDDALNAPLLLCHICRQWRRVALATPGLWASLFIDLDWFGLLDGVDDVVCDWLSRAGRMPLSLQIIDSDPGESSHLPELHTALKMIGNLSSQWQNISISVPPGYAQDLFPVAATFPRLVRLSLDLSSDDDPEPLPPTLKDTFSLREIQFYKMPFILATPLETLTVYRSEMMNVSQGLNVLRNCANLSCCTLSLVYLKLEDAITSLPPLVNLQTLTLSENLCDDVESLLTTELLRHLTLPALNHFTLKFEDSDDVPDADISHIILFLSRCSPKLQKLTLCFLPTSEIGLLQVLDCTQFITTLELQLHTPCDNVLTRLTFDIGFLPRLESLHIVHPTQSAPTPEAMFAMLFWRWYATENAGNDCAQLRSFQYDHAESEAMNFFQASMITDPIYELLEDSGMDLSIKKIEWSGEETWYISW